MTCAMKGTKLCGLSKWGSGVSPARFGYFAALQSNCPRGMSGEKLPKMKSRYKLPLSLRDIPLKRGTLPPSLREVASADAGGSYGRDDPAPTVFAAARSAAQVLGFRL